MLPNKQSWMRKFSSKYEKCEVNLTHQHNLKHLETESNLFMSPFDTLAPINYDFSDLYCKRKPKK